MPSSPALVLREAILHGLDPHLAELGFERRARSHEWIRHPAAEITHGVHINFGRTQHALALDLIPTLEVGIGAVERETAAAVGAQPRRNGCTFGRQLHTLLSCEYIAHTADGPEPMVERLAADIRRHGISCLEHLSSLDTVAGLLQSEEPKDWPILLGRSGRARLLPLVLALLGRTTEAHAWLERLRKDLAGRDQLRPDIDHFAAWFVARFGQAA